MRILGLNVFGHDHSIFFVDSDSGETCAVALERITRIKHDSGALDAIAKEYPEYFSNIDHVCLGAGGNTENSFTINAGKFYRNELIRRNLIYTSLQPRFKKDLVEIIENRDYLNPLKIGLVNFFKYLYRTFANKIFYRNDFDQAAFTKYLRKSLGLKSASFHYYDHHLCHAASAYYLGPFRAEDRVLSLTIDGYGDDAFSKVFLIENGKFDCVATSSVRPSKVGKSEEALISLGTLYGNFTEAMGLRRNSEEGKVEALAAFGDPHSEIYLDLMNSFQIEDNMFIFNDNAARFYDMSYLRQLRQRHGDHDFCAAIQGFLNDAVVKYLGHLRGTLDVTKLCLSGGVTANVIMNLRIFEECGYEDIHVFPAMADDGIAAGAAALMLNNLDLPLPRDTNMPYWGPHIRSREDLQSTLEANSERINFYEQVSWQEHAAGRLMNNEVGAIVQGKMEFGPRALGNRSIVASPLNLETKDKINLTVKKRPAYQPFCPSVLETERERLFERSFPNKHMTYAFRLRPEFRNLLPAAVHVDLTGRPQFVEERDNPAYFRLLSEFKMISGFGVLINTSFNLHGRTIVRTPQDAIDDFLDCNLDFLVIDSFFVTPKK